MEGVELKEKPEPRLKHYSVVISRNEFEVEAYDPQEAKKLASYLYREKSKSNLPLTLLQSIARHRCHEDGRVKQVLTTELVSLLELEENRRRFLQGEDELSEEDYKPAPGLQKPKTITPGKW